MRLRIYADGASWGNPGPAAIGAVIEDDCGRRLVRISEYIGSATNNQAEYQAVIRVLEAASKFEPEEVTLYLDSELVARQLTGKYKVKSASLYPLYAQAIRLIKRLRNLSIIHISHQENTEAHNLAKFALKKQLS